MVPQSWQGAVGLFCAARPGLPHVDTASSIWLQQSPHRAWLGPAAQVVAPWGNGFKGENTAQQISDKSGKNMKETALLRPKSMKKMGKEAFCVPEQLSLCVPQRTMSEQIPTLQPM